MQGNIGKPSPESAFLPDLRPTSHCEYCIFQKFSHAREWGIRSWERELWGCIRQSPAGVTPSPALVTALDPIFSLHGFCTCATGQLGHECCQTSMWRRTMDLLLFLTAAFTVGTHSAMKGCIGTGAECGKFKLEELI
jgi:hypothetical protein